MGFRDRLGSFIAGKDYKLGSPQQGIGVRYFEMQTPPGWGYQTYLKAYGEIGWLFAVVNVIAQAVSKVPWHLYALDKDGEQTKIYQHELIDLMNHCNPFQSRYQFFYLGMQYKLLVGEQFWQLNFDGGRKPVEMWQAPPAYMTVVPDATKYIGGYIYKRGQYEQRFNTDEIIHIKTPNPYNEYRGLSPAQALTVDLDSERFAARYQQKFFFNDASPGLILEFPPDQMPPAETRKELAQEWDERFKGFRNRGKTAFLWGGKANTITMTNKDMDFEKLRKLSRDLIAGAYHVPPSIMGVTDAVNRSNAESSLYTFAMYCVNPELAEIRECLNKELVPMFGDNLYLDYENPVPEDNAANVLNSTNLYKSSIITKNEARIMVDLEPVDTPDGEEFFVQPSPLGTFGGPGNNPPNNEPPEPKHYKAILTSETEREEYWKSYVSHAESYEAKTIAALQVMYLAQKQEALNRFKANPAKDTVLIDVRQSRKQYAEAMTGIMTQVLSGAIKNGQDLLTPPNPHKDAGQPEPVLPLTALKWLKTRITWAADRIGEESADRLATVLATGYEQGLSMDKIAAAISAEFDYFSDVRAQRIARTEIMSASGFGAVEGYKQSGIEKIQIYAAHDERECPLCNTLDGQVHGIDEGYMNPFHVNCLLPDVRVDASHIVSASRAFYRGKAVEITTKNGHVLTCTPNHPILTPGGFTRAECVHEGGHVISSLDSQRIVNTIDPYNNHTPTPIEDVWSTFRVKNGMTLTSMPVASVDFYGDAGGFDGNIDIIHPDGFLLNDVSNPATLEHIHKDSLCERHAQLLGLSSGGSHFPLSNSVIPPSGSDMRSGGACLALLERHPSHRSDIGLTAIPRRDTSGQQSAPDSTPVYTKLSRQFQLRFASLITQDEIIKVRNFNYSGHVYDLQSLEQLYIAGNTMSNGIIAHNCRCVLLPVVE